MTKKNTEDNSEEPIKNASNENPDAKQYGADHITVLEELKLFENVLPCI